MVADLAMVACACRIDAALPDGSFPVFCPTPRDAALVVKDFDERDVRYWAVHLDGLPPGADCHVTSVVVDGQRVGGMPDPA